MIIGEPLKRRHAVFLYSAQPTKGTPVTAATAVGIINPTVTMDGGLVDFFGLGSPDALFLQPGAAITRMSVAVTAFQDGAFIIRGKRASGSVPWNTVAIGVVDDAGTGHAFSFPDTKIGSMDLNAEAGGVLQGSIDLVSIGVMSEPTSLVAINLAKKPLMWYEGVVLRGGAAWEARSFRMSVNHNLDPKHVLYGVAPSSNKRAPKYLVEGNQVVAYETQRYARSAISMQADLITAATASFTFTDIAGGGTPNTLALSLAGSKQGEEEKSIGDDVVYRQSGRALTWDAVQTN